MTKIFKLLGKKRKRLQEQRLLARSYNENRIDCRLCNFLHSDWLKKLSSQSECLKCPLLKLKLKFNYRIVPSIW